MQDDPDPMLYYTIIAITLLLVTNAILVISSTSLSKVSRTFVKIYVKENQDKRAEKLFCLIEKPSRYIYTNKIISYVVVFAAISLALSYFEDNTQAVIINFVLVTLILTELLPRKLSLSHGEKFSITFANVQYFLCVVFRPITFILISIVNIILKIFKQDTHLDDSPFSEDHVMSMLDAGQDSGIIKEEGKNMINSIFAFDDELAYEIMTPRTDVFIIDINDPVEEYLDELMELKHSRIPVCKEETDNIIGILNIKDYLIEARKNGFENVDIASILRKPYFVPESKNIDSLFFDLQKSRQHIAILINEFGGFSGIVTMEDIIEEVMGDIDDEYDDQSETIQKVSDTKFLLHGNIYLDDFNDETGLELTSESSETIGGFIADKLGEIPNDGYLNLVVVEGVCEFKILSVRENRIEKIELNIVNIETDNPVE